MRLALPRYARPQELQGGSVGGSNKAGCLIAATVTLAVLGLAGAGWLWSMHQMFSPPDNHVVAQDSRVCSQTTGNNVSLADATSHFELVVPRDATHLTFTASVSSFQGEYDLSLRFTTTTGGLASFLDASHLSRPSATTKVTDGNWPPYPVSTVPQGPCGLTPPNDQRMIYSQDQPGGPMGNSPRSVAVDLSDPTHPEVWVDALDL
jgi:hypothetical protein